MQLGLQKMKKVLFVCQRLKDYPILAVQAFRLSYSNWLAFQLAPTNPASALNTVCYHSSNGGCKLSATKRTRRFSFDILFHIMEFTASDKILKYNLDTYYVYNLWMKDGIKKVKRPFSRSWRPNFGFHLFLMSFHLEFSSFWVSRSFDLGVLRKSPVNIFNDYIFEISLFHWSKCTIECAIRLTLILKSARARGVLRERL